MTKKTEADPEGEARQRIRKRIAASRKAEPNTVDRLRGETLKVLLKDARTGFTSGLAVEELDKLTFEQMKRLAAMAIRFYDNCWTDRDRDLTEGVRAVLGRKGENEEMYG